MQNKFKCISSFNILNLKNNSQLFKSTSNLLLLDGIRKNFLDFFKIIIIFIVAGFFLGLELNQFNAELDLIT